MAKTLKVPDQGGGKITPKTTTAAMYIKGENDWRGQTCALRTCTWLHDGGGEGQVWVPPLVKGHYVYAVGLEQMRGIGV